MSRKRMSFNANSPVYVRLTEHGLQILRDEATALRVAHPTATAYKDPTPDDRGFYQFTLWQFMETFGPHTSWGENPYEMGMEFELRDLQQVQP